MAAPNSSDDMHSDSDIPGSDVSHPDVGFKKFFSSVKKLTKRVGSLSESPVPSPTISRKSPTVSSSQEQSCDVFFGNPRNTRVISPTPEHVYDFNYRSRGVAVMIVNITFLDKKMCPDREYAKHDILVFQELLKSLNFTIIKLEDKTTDELRKRLEEIQTSLTADCDCFLCLISSHGLETRIKYNKRKRQHTTFTKDRWISTDSIIRNFTDCRCLNGKPKLFFIQACRSVHNAKDADSVDKGVFTTDTVRQIPTQRGDISAKKETSRHHQDNPNHSSEDLSKSITGRVNLLDVPFADDSDNNDDIDLSSADNILAPYFPPRPRLADDDDFCTIPCYRDCLVMYSSAPERIAWSNDLKGGWLPYCMYKVIDKMTQHDFRIDLLDALTEVNETMAKTLETSSPEDRTFHGLKSAACIYHMLTKDIYFTPKYAPVPVLDRVQVSAV